MSQALTARQDSFLAAYTGNATQAAIDAGYSPRSARQQAARMMANAAIQAALAARQGEDARRLEISRQDAIRGLLEAIDQAREQSNPAAMIAGWREVGRMLGFYEPQRHAVEVSTAASAEAGRYERMTDAELIRLVAAG
jgi:hypothetical protein